MSLKASIVHDKMMAMKMRDTKLSTVLGTLIGELDRDKYIVDPKNPTDAEVLKVIKRNIDTNIENNINEFETQVLSQYLPKTLSELELNTIIQNQITTNNYAGMKDMGKIMKFLTDTYPSQYDGKLAGELTKKALA
jgi:uncharacterized protein